MSPCEGIISPWLRVFVSQATAMGQCGQPDNTGPSPPALSDRDPDAIVYDCRSPVLSVSIRMRGPQCPCVVVSAVSSNIAAPPGEVGSAAGVSFPDQGAASALASESFGDPGTDLEDELCNFSPLPETISPLPESGENLSPISPSQYPATLAPDIYSPSAATRVSPAPLLVVNSTPTIDVFPTYTMSPAVSYYEPSTSPVTPVLPETLDYVSPRSPTSMDNFLAGDGWDFGSASVAIAIVAAA